MNQKTNKGKLIALFTTFIKIGTFTFGGGYAMIPFIRREIVETHKWINENEMLDIFAIAQIAPGVIAVNTATYVGYKVGGFWGAVVSTVGIVLPTFIITFIISFFLVQFRQIVWVEYAFRGIRIGVIVLMIDAIIKLMKADRVNILYVVILSATFIVATFTSINIVLILLTAVAVGVVYALLAWRKGRFADK